MTAFSLNSSSTEIGPAAPQILNSSNHYGCPSWTLSLKQFPTTHLIVPVKWSGLKTALPVQPNRAAVTVTWWHSEVPLSQLLWVFFVGLFVFLLLEASSYYMVQVAWNFLCSSGELQICNPPASWGLGLQVCAFMRTSQGVLYLDLPDISHHCYPPMGHFRHRWVLRSVRLFTADLV